jgi:hypothetical protein
MIGPGCVRSPGIYVSPKESGGVRVTASLADLSSDWVGVSKLQS